MPASLRWYASNVKAEFKKTEKEGLLRVGLLARRQIRRNITENQQIDTKFLWNSVYVATPGRHTDIVPDGEYRSSRTGQMVKRQSANIALPSEGVHVGVAAEYAVQVEMRRSFLWAGVESVAGREAEEAFVGLQTTLIDDD